MEPATHYPYLVYLKDRSTKIGSFMECTLDITNPKAVGCTLGRGIINSKYKYLFEQKDVKLCVEVGELDDDWLDIHTCTDYEIQKTIGGRLFVVRWKSIGIYPNYNFITNG